MKMTATNESKEIRILRTYDAPLKAVWDAWTDPAQVAQWWGPRGFTLTTHSKDLRTGGNWTYTMHGPDGTDYPNNTHYLEVEPLAKLVYDHGANDDRPPMFRVTVLFAEVDGKTSMDMCMSLPSAEAAVQTRQFIKQAGGNATWDRLAEYLAKRLSDSEKFVINRSFDASQAVMFEMWTNPEHFARWLAPTGFEMRFIRADIKTGGSTFYCMTGPGATMYGRAHYEEIRSPDRLVYTQQFCADLAGNHAYHRRPERRRPEPHPRYGHLGGCRSCNGRRAGRLRRRSRRHDPRLDRLVRQTRSRARYPHIGGKLKSLCRWCDSITGHQGITKNANLCGLAFFVYRAMQSSLDCRCKIRRFIRVIRPAESFYHRSAAPRTAESPAKP